MSLIEEALRKVREPSMVKTPEAPPANVKTKTTSPHAHSWTVESPASALRKTSSRRRALPLLHLLNSVIVLSATVLLIVGGAWISRAAKSIHIKHSQASTPKPSEIAATFPSSPEATVAPESPAAPPLPPPPLFAERLILTGIAEGRGEAYAMINGSILVVGERIADYVVTEITKNSVRLLKSDGSETILHVAR